jgi:hypothetical protein
MGQTFPSFSFCKQRWPRMHEHSDKHLQEGLKKKSIAEFATSLAE